MSRIRLESAQQETCAKPFLSQSSDGFSSALAQASLSQGECSAIPGWLALHAKDKIVCEPKGYPVGQDFDKNLCERRIDFMVRH